MSLSDKELSLPIHAHAAELNRATGEALRAGLRVEVAVTRDRPIGQRHDRPYIQVTVQRVEDL